jgi:uncharacterized protein (TIGR02186 family)
MRIVLTVLFLLMMAAPAFAMAIDVSDETIRVTTGFNGASVTVFGTQDKPGSVVIVVEGPSKLATVRKKERVMGLWTNTDSRRFVNIPAFYEVAASGPLELIAPKEVLGPRRIGIDNIPVMPARGNATDAGTPDFAKALFDTQVKKQLYVTDVAPLAYPGPMLFKARFSLPAVVPQGQYKVSAYLFQNGQIIEEDSIPFVIVAEGLSANVRDFATSNGLLYGLTGLLMALVAGWLATVLLKRD